MRSYGIQLYSVRDAMEKDVFSTLKKIAEIGYKYVEFAGFFGHSAEDIRNMLEDTGLVCSGTHSGWDDLRPEKIENTISYHKKIGNPYYIVPGADLSTLEKIDDELLFQALHSELQQMSEAERLLFDLRFTDELSIKEIAVIIHIPEGTVKSRLHTLIQKLRKNLHDYV